MLVFSGIDYWNRPVFRDEKTNRYYGSVDILFDYCAGEKEVLASITEKDLCYFGRELDCEPMGTPLPPNLKIRRP